MTSSYGWPFFTTPYSSDIWNDESSSPQSGEALDRANIDWRESPTAHIFTLDLPGVRKQDLKVEVEDDNILHITGNRVMEKEEETGHWLECHRGTLSRRFRLPENAGVEGIKCSLEDGVLRVEVPKKGVKEEPRKVRYVDVA